jgi:F420H(2)-dependent quinone reductase
MIASDESRGAIRTHNPKAHQRTGVGPLDGGARLDPDPPGWWLNLQAQPDCEAFVGRRWRPVRGREATEAEANVHWRALATRALPVVILQPR